jgi:CDP-2,3-bis-(O-geranylgeranyl)-sn-glycerol synthase
MLELLLTTIWLLLPAYTPNNFAVIFGGGMPIDLGKKFIDGKRVLGDGKTIRGFVFGVVGGVFCGVLQYHIEAILGIRYFSGIDVNSAIFLFFLLSFGSLFGDVFGSFIKRRVGIERGKSFPVFDQLTFLLFAYIFAYAFSPYFLTLFTKNVILAGILITPALHLGVNYIAYKLGLKDVPW